MPTHDYVIETRALSKRYGRKLALDHLDLAIPRGRIHAVVGPFYSGFNASPLAAVVSVYSLGFEGPNRRFVTVPIVP